MTASRSYASAIEVGAGGARNDLPDFMPAGAGGSRRDWGEVTSLSVASERTVRFEPVPVRINPEDPSAWSRGEVLRLLLTPIIAIVLLVGGVYWMRLQFPAAHPESDQSAVLQVRLVPRPAQAEISRPPASQRATARLVKPTSTSEERESTSADRTIATPAPPDAMPIANPAPSVRPTPSLADAPPSSAALRFQQALIRHVTRYQRYPKAARAERLHGSVDAKFAMGRDGSVLGVWVRTGSGQPVLDKEALDTIRRAQPLPAIPAELPDRLNIQVTLTFDPP